MIGFMLALSLLTMFVAATFRWLRTFWLALAISGVLFYSWLVSLFT